MVAARIFAYLGIVALIAAPTAFLLSGLLHWPAAHRAAWPLCFASVAAFSAAALLWFSARKR